MGPAASDMYSQPSNIAQTPPPQQGGNGPNSSASKYPSAPGAGGNPVPAAGLATAPFFAEQLTAFEVWLEFGGQHRSRGEPPPRPPEQLPVVLQVLLSQAHRVRALVLLRRFLDLGPWAVNLALSVGIFPYVLKLLQSPAPELRQVLVAIWSKILAFDASCQSDLVKDKAHVHFISHLNWGLNAPPKGGDGGVHGAGQKAASQRVMAAFVIANICRDYNIGQQQCLKSNLHAVCAELLRGDQGDASGQRIGIPTMDAATPPRFRLWLLICLAELCKGYETAQREVMRQGYHERIYAMLGDSCSDVRAGAAYAVGMLMGGGAGSNSVGGGDRTNDADARQDVVSARELMYACNDASTIVRYEATVSIGVFVGKYRNQFAAVANIMMKNGRRDSLRESASVSDSIPKIDGGFEREADIGIRDEGSSSRGNRGVMVEAGLGSYLESIERDLEQDILEDFTIIWSRLKDLQNTDPHPNVASAAHDIVSVVHERVIYLGQILLGDTGGGARSGGEIGEDVVGGKGAAGEEGNM